MSRPCSSNQAVVMACPQGWEFALLLFTLSLFCSFTLRSFAFRSFTLLLFRSSLFKNRAMGANCSCLSLLKEWWQQFAPNDLYKRAMGVNRSRCILLKEQLEQIKQIALFPFFKIRSELLFKNERFTDYTVRVNHSFFSLNHTCWGETNVSFKFIALLAL